MAAGSMAAGSMAADTAAGTADVADLLVAAHRRPSTRALVERTRREAMVARVPTVAFCRIDVRAVDAPVTVASGAPAFTVIGLPDKAVGGSRERVGLPNG
jgi:hypothetical protein